MPIEVTWTAIPNGIENGKLKLALMATIKLTSASTNETTLGASFAPMQNWHKNKFTFVLTFAGAMGVKTFNIGPLAVPSQTCWPATFKADTPVKPYKWEGAPIRRWESYSVSRLLERTQTAYAEIAVGSLTPRYTRVTQLVQNQFKAPDIYRSPFFQPRIDLDRIGGVTNPLVRPGPGSVIGGPIPGAGIGGGGLAGGGEIDFESFPEDLYAATDMGTGLYGSAKEMLAMAYKMACDEWRNEGGELPEDEALWWEARNFFEAYDRHEEEEQITARPPIQVRPNPGIRPEAIGTQRPRYRDPYAGRPMAVVQPRLEFHEALGILGEHPSLMRQFGIIFDVEVPVASATLAATGSVTVAATWTTDGGGGGSASANPLTSFQYNAAQNVFLPAHKGTPEYSRGFYNLGSEYCQITGVDVDSMAIRVLDFAGSMRNKFAFNARTSLSALMNTSPATVGATAPPPTAASTAATRPPATTGATTARPPVSLVRPGTAIQNPSATPGRPLQERPTHQMMISESLFLKLGDRPDTAAPPGFRSAGISIARKDRSQRIQAVMASAVANMAKMTAPKTVTLFFEDMIRGYRLDVFTEGKWHSLSTRQGAYTLPGNVPVPNIDEESWVSAAASSDPQAVAAERDRGKIHEVMVRWNGYSLVNQRPSQTLDQANNVIEGGTQLDPRFPIRMQFKVRPGTLPTLRFGERYRFRLRLATIAGTGPELDATAPGAPYETPLLTYKRWESVMSPAIYPHAATREGESAQHIVIRKFVADPNNIAPALRELVPPSGEVSMAETHGMFDAGGKPDPAAYAKIQERDNMTPLGETVGGTVNRLPYFADPMAQGATIQGAPHVAAQLSLSFPGAWPEQKSIRLEVRPGAAASTAAGDKFTLFLTPGEIAFPKLSSTVDPANTELFGLLDWIPAAQRANVAAAVRFGRVWTITPFRESTTVFACQIPEQAPTPDRPFATRSPGATNARFGGRVQTHSWTTSSVDFQAKWTDDVDLMEESTRTTETVDKNANAFKLKIVRGPTSPVVFQPFTEAHEFGDTKHHAVTFDLVGHTSFKQYFPPNWPLASNPEGTRFTETKENAFTVNVPSSQPPAPPLVEYIVPSYSWAQSKSADGRTATSSRSGNWLRVYLRRPWFSSGNGEKLAVVLLGASNTNSYAAMPDKIKQNTTRMGADPVIKTGDVPTTVTTANFLGGEAAVSGLSVPTIKGATASIVPYPVQYDNDKQMWYADIAVNVGMTYTPFVRLALARYQRFALSGMNLSSIVVADIMQVQANRSATVTFNDAANRIKASVVGAIGETIAGPNKLFGTIEEKVGADDETGWRIVMVNGKELSREIPISLPTFNPGTIAIPINPIRPPGGLIRPPGGTVRPPEEEEPIVEAEDAGQATSPQLRPGALTPPQVRPGTTNPQIRPEIGNITIRETEGEFTLPKPRSQGTFRLVIREYEVYPSDDGDAEMPETPTFQHTSTRIGGRLVYMDVIPLT